MGGGELSFGSDLDIVFVYGEDGETDGARPQGNLQFFIDLAQQMIAMLEQNTPQGKLYPVDPRLRPEGASGLLALSLEAYGRYLETRASTWERMALSRSRVVAGDPVLGEKLLNLFEPFIVGTGFLDAEVATMLDIRKKMERKDGQRSRKVLSIKTDAGGIVDIEFIAQILQLKFAKEHPELRSANTLEALGRLVKGRVFRGRRCTTSSASICIFAYCRKSNQTPGRAGTHPLAHRRPRVDSSGSGHGV